jgi:lipoyl(octanoyl) transferase
VAELGFVHLGFGPDSVEYTVAWEEQRRVHAARFADQIEDTCLLLEHLPVYTAGRRTDPSERPLDGTPVVDVDRGGKITWHGPGQLVGYPIVKLPGAILVVDYVRRLEEAMIGLFADYGLDTGRVRGRSGVWLAADQHRPERKIAAIGIRVAAGTTMHGFAINVDPDLRRYDTIIPCGLTDVGVASMTAELGRPVGVPEVADRLLPHLPPAGDRARGALAPPADPSSHAGPRAGVDERPVVRGAHGSTAARAGPRPARQGRVDRV